MPTIFNVRLTRYHIVDEAPLTDLSVFQWKGKGVGVCTAHLVDTNERNRMMLYMYTNMPELLPYFEVFDDMYRPPGQLLTQKQTDDIRLNGARGGRGFVTWFHEHVIIFLLIMFSIVCFYFLVFKIINCFIM